MSFGANTLPNSEETFIVGKHTYTKGDLSKGELKVFSIPQTELLLCPSSVLFLSSPPRTDLMKNSTCALDTNSEFRAVGCTRPA